MKHTILGAGGTIANVLAYELLRENESVRLVSRSNYSIIGAESFKADITSYEETLNSVKGSDIVYLVAGLPYNRKVWAEMWPKVMKNTIDACKNYGAKLIFFDNVYMYGKVNGKMTEETPYNPCSVKGEIRANIATMLENEMKQNNIKALIARSADFYGPYAAQSSVPYFLAIQKMMNGKSGQWLGNDQKSHSFTYTLDSASGLNMLWKSDDYFQQTWHLPTFNPAIDGKTFIEILAKELDMEPKYSVLKKWMVAMAGIFNTMIFESLEMLYQSENEYYFDSAKFNERFNFNPTSYQQGIKETIEFYRGK